MAYIFGHERTVYFNPESTFDVSVAPAAGDAVRTTSMSFGAGHGTAIPNDRTGTLDHMERVVTRQPEQPWALAGILRPSGALGTAPDIGNILTHTLGTETVTASTSVAYTLLKDKTALSATIIGLNDDNIMVGVSGAIVQSFGFTWSGESEITWSASGVAASYIQVGATQADGAGSSTTALVVDDGSFMTVGGFVKIGTDDNSGAGYRIAAKSGENITLGTAATWSDNDAVVPFLPAATYAGAPLYGNDGSVSLDNGSSTIDTISGSLTMATGLGLVNNTFGGDKPSGVKLMGKRDNDFSLTMLLDSANNYLMQDFRANTSYDVQIILGDTAAKRVKVNMNNSYFNPEAMPDAEADVLPWTVPGKAFGTSGEDSIDLLLD